MSCSNSALKYIRILDLDESNFNSLKSKFNKLKLSRVDYVKLKNIDTWNNQPFVPVEAQDNDFPKKRKINTWSFIVNYDYVIFQTIELIQLK